MTRLLSLAAVAVTTFTCSLTVVLADAPTFPVEGGIMPLVIGHRGYSANFPENTMISFQGAIDAGAQAIESDLRLSSDGVIFLMHDPTLNRTTNCTGPIANYTSTELASCNANFASKFPNSDFGFVPIPKFEDVLQVVLQTGVSFVLDLKDSCTAQPCLASYIRPLLVKYNAFNSVYLNGWTIEAVQDAASLIPESTRHFLNETAPGTEVFNGPAWQMYRSVGVDAFSLSGTELTQAIVQAAHRKFFPVMVWTVDDPAQMQQLIDWGVDGILTDDAPLALSVVNSRGVQALAGDPANGPVANPCLDPDAQYSSAQLGIGIGISVVASILLGSFLTLWVQRCMDKKKRFGGSGGGGRSKLGGGYDALGLGMMDAYDGNALQRAY